MYKIIKYCIRKPITMKITKILGLIAIAYAPITALGMAIDIPEFWLGYDISIMIAAPIVGYVLFKK